MGNMMIIVPPKMEREEAFVNRVFVLLLWLTVSGCGLRCLISGHQHTPDPQLTEHFDESPFTDSRNRTLTVYHVGSGPPLILLHELPGMTPHCLHLAEELAKAGYGVYLPLFFDRFDHRQHAVVGICKNGEFHCFARSEAAPVASWVGELAAHINKDTSSGVAVIGMCLTGNIPLSLMKRGGPIRAAVMSQPAMPFALLGLQSTLGVPQTDVDAARNSGIPILALRFTKDCIAPEARFDTLKRVFGDQIEIHEYFAPSTACHAVLTDSLMSSPESRRALGDVIRFLDTNMKAQ